MRAVVLARGLARRMRLDDADATLTAEQIRAASVGQKAMMPLGGPHGTRPFLDHVLTSLADAGYRQVALVVGPESEGAYARYGREVPLERIALSFVVQPEARGTADAVAACETWADGNPFTVVNADNLYPVEVLQALGELHGPGLPVFRRDRLIAESGIPAGRVASFALLGIAPDGTLERIVEKPGEAAMSAAGPDAAISMNCWRLDERVLAACRDVPASPRGEFELPMAVGLAVSRGVRFATFPAHGAVLDLSRRADVAAVSAKLAGRAVRL